MTIFMIVIVTMIMIRMISMIVNISWQHSSGALYQLLQCPSRDFFPLPGPPSVSEVLGYSFTYFEGPGNINQPQAPAM